MLIGECAAREGRGFAVGCDTDGGAADVHGRAAGVGAGGFKVARPLEVNYVGGMRGQGGFGVGYDVALMEVDSTVLCD